MGFETADYVTRARSTEFEHYHNNSVMGHIMRNGSGIRIATTANIQYTGPGTLTLPLLVYTGTVSIINQFATIVAVTDLTNCTDVYSDVYDDVSTNPKKLNQGNPGGAVLSGAPVGTFILKGEDNSQPYVVLPADEARFFEPGGKYVGYPFFTNANPAANNYIRIHLTTSGSVDFTIRTIFEFELLTPDASLEFM